MKKIFLSLIICILILGILFFPVSAGWGKPPKPTPNPTPVPTQETEKNSPSVSDVVKVLSAEYSDGVLYLNWIGIPSSARICKNNPGKNCAPNLNAPTVMKINSKGYFGYMLVSLDKGVYFVDLQGSKNGNDAVKFIVE